MSTFLYDFVCQLDAKWKEVDLLISKAKTIKNGEQELHNAICRSVTVLIVAHLEGFIKDLAKCIVSDLNNKITFSQLPDSIKRTYCKKYLGNNSDSKEYDRNMNKLMDKFDELNCKLSYEPFLFSANKNPNPNVVETIFKNFGINNIFIYLHDSELDNVFSESNQSIKKRISLMQIDIKKEVKEFPYTFDKSKYLLDKSSSKGNNRTLWQEFLDQINQKRHSVAHGNEFENADDASVLEDRKDRVVLFQLGLIGILSSHITNTINI